jgi:hypothetical protein
VELQHHRLLDKSIRIAGYSTEDPGVLELKDVVMVELMFCHGRFAWLSKPYVPVVLFYSVQYRSTSLSDVHLTTLGGYAVNPRSPQSHVVLYRTKENGDLLTRQVNTFMLCLANLLLRRPCYVWSYGRKATDVCNSFGRTLHDYIVVKELFHR